MRSLQHFKRITECVVKVGDLIVHMMGFGGASLVLAVDRSSQGGVWLKLLGADGEIFHTYGDNYEVISGSR